ESWGAEGPDREQAVWLHIARIAHVIESAVARWRQSHGDVRPFIFGHFGDGNLHYNLSRPAGAPREWAAEHGAAVTDVVLDEGNRYGGSISAEHGIGQLKRDHFLHSKNPLELRLMRDIKRLLDPAGILNPGKLL